MRPPGALANPTAITIVLLSYIIAINRSNGAVSPASSGEGLASIALASLDVKREITGVERVS